MNLRILFGVFFGFVNCQTVDRHRTDFHYGVLKQTAPRPSAAVQSIKLWKTDYAIAKPVKLDILEMPDDSIPDKDRHRAVQQKFYWIDIVDGCAAEMREQINTQIDASNKYLQLGAYFSRETVNRPGLANLFFEAAKEERKHASKLISYLLMRGRLASNTDDMTELFKFPSEYKLDLISEDKSYSGLAALKKALKMEKSVTDSIKNLIKACEADPATKFNDYHLVDYLIGDLLTEQYEEQRQLAGHMATLSKLMGQNKEIGEFLFDKTLL